MGYFFKKEKTKIHNYLVYSLWHIGGSCMNSVGECAMSVPSNNHNYVVHTLWHIGASGMDFVGECAMLAPSNFGPIKWGVFACACK